GWNHYTYTANNPTTWTDPTGQAPFSEYVARVQASARQAQAAFYGLHARMSIWYFGLGPLGACGAGAALGIGEELAIAGYDGRIDPYGLAFSAGLGCLADTVDRFDNKPEQPETPTAGRPRDGYPSEGGEFDNVGSRSSDRGYRSDLGEDPATGGRFNQSEYETALLVESEKGVSLRRDPSGNTEWIDESERTYDAVGGFDGQYFDAQWPNLQHRIDEHRQYADLVPVDVSNFSPDQRSQVESFVSSLDDPAVFIVGDS
ncbi:MAG: hypothetical protein GY701_06805, partial [Sulfitobacter sp.]|nr:hypothetical protein [Sulfitobacter sp.]